MVYQRTGEPCLRCGRPIRRIVVGGRATHFCSWCQRLPAADRAGARAILRTMSVPGADGPALVGAAGRGGERRAGDRGRQARARAPGDARRADPPGGGDAPRGRARLRRRLSRCRSSASSGSAARSGTFVILDDITAAIAVDDRIGLVGPNGAGKTTLLRLAAGRDEPDDGDGPPQARADDRPARPGVALRRGVHGRARTCAPRSATARPTSRRWPAELAELEQAGQVEAPATPTSSTSSTILGGYTLDQRVDEALSGLGFTRDEWAKPPTALSGGEQTRATLARLVIAQPDLLLLDEPTNHLDIGAIEWLEEHLRRRHGALLVASHDRAFLDATVTRIWELRDRRLTASAATTAPTTASAWSATLRAAKDADTPGRPDRAREGARPALPLASQVQQDARARGAAREAPGRAGRGAEGDEEAAPPGRRPGRRRPVALRRDRDPGRGPRRRLPAGSRRRDRRRRAGDASRSASRPCRSWPRRAATGSGSSGRTGPARRRCCGRSPATCRRSTAR